MTWKLQAETGGTDIPLPSHVLQPERSWGVPKPDETDNPSSIFWAYPQVFLMLDVPKKRETESDAQTTSTDSKIQRHSTLYSDSGLLILSLMLFYYFCLAYFNCTKPSHEHVPPHCVLTARGIFAKPHCCDPAEEQTTCSAHPWRSPPSNIGCLVLNHLAQHVRLRARSREQVLPCIAVCSFCCVNGSFWFRV